MFEQFQKDDEQAYNSKVDPLKKELDKLYDDNKDRKNDEAIEKLTKCIDSIYEVHEKEKNKIESSIKTIKDAINIFESYYTKVNPDESVDKDPPQISYYEMSHFIKANLDYDPDKPLKYMIIMPCAALVKIKQAQQVNLK